MTASPRKTQRIDIRTTTRVKQTLQRAAAITQRNVSDFLIEAGLRAAEDALADRRRFVLDDKNWDAFQRILDRPARFNPKLAKLLAETNDVE